MIQIVGTPTENGTGTTLPASWYRSKEIYELERRAIFAKNWLMVAHELRFREIGEFVRYEIAGYPFFLIKDRSGKVNAFLNACRHRAFPAVLKDEGVASIIACKYHGWSYGLSGNLAKAPKFDSILDFQKNEHGLFRVHTHADKRGFIWVNLDAAESPEVAWEDTFAGVDTQERLNLYTMEDFFYVRTWTMPGKYNWKTIIDNYNECYHCLTSHPRIVATANLETYDVAQKGGYIQHFVADKNGLAEHLDVAPTYLFPNASYTMTNHFFYNMRVVPISPTTVMMQYDTYRHKDATDTVWEELDDMFRQIEREDKWLSDGAQSNLNANTYVAGPLHPHNEKGVLFFQRLVRDAVMHHRKREVGESRQIWPSERGKLQKQTSDDQAFCEQLCNEEIGAKYKW